MWWLLRLLFVGPPSKLDEIPLRRQIRELTEDVSSWEQKQAALRGQLLTQTRRITRLEAEMDVEDDDEPEGEDDFNKLLEEKRRSRG